MKKMKKLNQAAFTLSIIFAVVLIGIIPVSYAKAAGAKITPKKIKMSVDETQKIKVTGTKKAVKWKTTNKKVVAIRKKTKNSVTIRALSAGKAKIKASGSGKTLICNVTVKKEKHVHSYTIPATCTTPAMCSCGKTFGVPLGHNMSIPTCQAPSTCSRCGITSGSAVDHSYDQNNYCIWCHQFNLKSVLTFELTNTASEGKIEVFWVGVYCYNKGNVPFTVVGGSNPGIVHPGGNMPQVNTYLTDVDNKQLFTDICNANSEKLFFFDDMTDNKFTFMLDGTISFYGQYNGTTYLFKVYSNGAGWTYDYSKV